MSLKQYLDLNLQPNSEVVADLFSRLPSDTRLTLTPEYSVDGTPAFITPSMSGWYNSQISSVRSGAIHEIVENFHGQVIPKNKIRGKLIERERDLIDLQAFEKIAEERSIFEANTNIVDVHRELLEQRKSYDELVQKHGEAQKWRPWLYYTVLASIILLLEGLLNFESFLKIPGFTPAFALGSFLAVSVAFASSAHLVGLIVKQWQYRLGRSVKNTEKGKNKFLLWLAITLFILAFALVIYARWALLGDVILRKSQTTGEEIGSEEVFKFAGTLIGNFIVYLMGIGWSYSRHDAIPKFSELRQTVERLEREESVLLEKNLATRFREFIAKAQEEKENLRKSEQSQAAQLPNYQVIRGSFNRLREQDAKVLALLEKYKGQLLDRMAGNETSVQLTYSDTAKIGVDTQCEMSADDYASRPIVIRYV
jgi:hypothetical protein